jgi:hypothetical protein
MFIELKQKLVEGASEGGRAARVAFSADGERALTSNGALGFRVWDVSTARIISEVAGDPDESDAADVSWIRASAISPDGNLVATGGAERRVHLWDALTGKLLRAIPCHSEWVYCVAFTPDGRKVVSSAGKGRPKPGQSLRVLMVHEVETGNLVADLSAELDFNVRDFALLGETRCIVPAKGAVLVYDLSSGDKVRRLELGKAELGTVALSPDGSKAALIGNDHHFYCVALESGNVLSKIRSKDVRALQYTADPDVVIGLTSTHHLMAWEVSSGRQLQKVRLVEGIDPSDSLLASSMAFSPDRRQLLVGAAGFGCFLYDFNVDEVRDAPPPTSRRERITFKELQSMERTERKEGLLAYLGPWVDGSDGDQALQKISQALIDIDFRAGGEMTLILRGEEGDEVEVQFEAPYTEDFVDEPFPVPASYQRVVRMHNGVTVGEGPPDSLSLFGYRNGKISSNFVRRDEPRDIQPFCDDAQDWWVFAHDRKKANGEPEILYVGHGGGFSKDQPSEMACGVGEFLLRSIAELVAGQ